MIRKSLAVKLFVFLVMLLLAAPQALAASIPFRVYIDGELNPDSSFVTRKNALKVRVYDSAGADHTVKVGNVVATKVGPGEYEVDKYLLKTGTNRITVSADTYKDTYNITYVDEALPGASYYLPAINNMSTITAINKTINLKFPKNNYIVKDGNKPQVVSDQGITIEVARFDNDDSPTIYHQAVSPVYVITPDSNELDSDSERKRAALLYPGELTLKYDANVSAAAAGNLTVVYIPYKVPDYNSYDNEYRRYWSDSWSARECVVLGGSVNTAAHTITVPFSRTGFGTYAVFNVNREFTDIKDTWARNYVLPLWAKGVMEKLGANEKFNDAPNKPITREEFTVAIVKAMGIPVESGLQNPFRDVNSKYLEIDKHDDYILTASKNGIINGFPESGGTYFHPEKGLSREEAATIIARVANLKVSDSETVTAAAMEKAFKDFDPDKPDNFSAWATPYIYAAYKAGFIQGIPVGNDNKEFVFNPRGKLTRTEAAKLIYVLMQKEKKL